MKKIILAGGFGKMGQAIQTAITNEPDLELAGILSHTLHEADVPVFTDLQVIDVQADIWVDVTNPTGVFANAEYALKHGMNVVIGTSGLAEEQIEQLRQIAKATNQHAIIVPNFSLSAVLLMQFAQKAAAFFPNAEILEIHHPGKIDAPSGTAKATAKLIAEARKTAPVETNHADQARGVEINDVPVHAMRLPGYVAEEEVVFGAPGETLRIKQTSFSRESFMGGVILAIRGVEQIHGVQVGLEHLLF
ncbi:MAG: 4-hydroxy-tetrahydrodipicolinate reductase [Lactobacillaceae bacterium]|jgi:4-hydroxy-tetrahydrodipicolinate reductase|nr:4-hydroxy-tetrahydrodipicolinate reductase [Lactobacillaceae bacterium]